MMFPVARKEIIFVSMETVLFLTSFFFASFSLLVKNSIKFKSKMKISKAERWAIVTWKKERYSVTSIQKRLKELFFKFT